MFWATTYRLSPFECLIVFLSGKGLHRALLMSIERLFPFPFPDELAISQQLPLVPIEEIRLVAPKIEDVTPSERAIPKVHKSIRFHADGADVWMCVLHIECPFA